MGPVISSNTRYAAAYLVLMAMILRALLPAGWMPDPAAGHHHFITFCTMDGPQHLDLNPGPSHHAPAPSHDTGFCPFAASAHFAPPAQIAAFDANLTIVPHLANLPDLDLHQTQKAGSNYSSRAPPVTG